MPKDMQYSLYLDFYGGLLTQNQREALELYYYDDYSLAEIADVTGVTRQGVLDAIHRGQSKLVEYEAALGTVSKYLKTTAALKELEAVGDDTIKEKVSQIRDIWEQ